MENNNNAEFSELCQKIEKEIRAVNCSELLEDAVETHIEFIWITIDRIKRNKEILSLVVDSLVENNIKGLTENVLSLLVENKDELAGLKGAASQNVRSFLSVVWIVTDSSSLLCHQLVCSVAIQKTSQLLDFLKDTTQNESVLFLVKFILGCWHNCLRHVSSAAQFHFRELNIKTTTHKTIARFEDSPMILAKGIIVLSYLLTENDEEEEGLLETNILGFIVQILSQAVKAGDRVSRRHGMNVQEVLQGINNLSVNDKNKEELVARGALPILVQILKDKVNPREVIQTLMIIWRISFLNQNFSRIISEPDLISVVERLQFDENEKIRHSATGALWEIKQSNLSIYPINDDPRPHVMISYQWDSQPVMLKVKDSLKQAGYKVWMDVENISGSTVEAMSLAIENAAVVLICMSQKYKESPSCRSEAEYAYKLRKCVVPLRLEPRYVPDGWLGLIIGTKLYFDFTSEKRFDFMVGNLIKELGSRGRIFDMPDITDGKEKLGRQDTVHDKKSVRDVQNRENVYWQWTEARIKEWIDSCNLSSPIERLYDLDPELLSELRLLQSTSPDSLYSVLRSDLLLSGVDVIKFSKELRKLADH
ncbi:uncharacterized protein LOC133187346 [Saccostrea echinata]|uniref:uncharacterized protein LOC133187346 n=1 Tax=Saccostrea echinata TaxID=191078 RepID=UPI002A7EB4E1|nr:uncharacterized protein LOC133187346 [Saccostrea echinata]